MLQPWREEGDKNHKNHTASILWESLCHVQRLVFTYIGKGLLDNHWNICIIKKFETTSCFPPFLQLGFPHTKQTSPFRPTDGFVGLAIGIATRLPLRIHLYPEAHQWLPQTQLLRELPFPHLCRAACSVPVFSKAQLWKATLKLSSWQAEHQHRKTDDCTKGLLKLMKFSTLWGNEIASWQLMSRIFNGTTTV